jgi:ribosome-interacting GTPase 1
VDHVPPGSPGLWRLADGLIVVADLSSDSVLDDVECCLGHLAERRIEMTDGPRQRPTDLGEAVKVPGFVLANKMDVPGAEDKLAMLRELLEARVRIEPFSTRDEGRMAWLGETLFKLVRAIRVYAKPPGKKPDLDEPFVLDTGSDIHELARKVYRGLENRVRSARLWGHGVADGQNVHLDHVLHDKDIVELHS